MSENFVIIKNLQEWDILDVCEFANYSVTLFFIDWLKKHQSLIKGSPLKYLDCAILAFENTTEKNLDLFAESKHRKSDGYRKQYKKMYCDAISHLRFRYIKFKI